MKPLKIITLLLFSFMLLSIVSGCTDAQIASSNLSQAAEQFEIKRRIVFFNGITDKYLLSITGRCSIDVQTHQNQLEVTCKTGDNSFKKHHLGLSDNVSYFSEQLKMTNASTYYYRIIFKPRTIIPNIDLR